MNKKKFILVNTFTVLFIIFFAFDFYYKINNGFSAYDSNIAIFTYIYLFIWGLLNMVLYKSKNEGLYNIMGGLQFTAIVISVLFYLYVWSVSV